QCAYALYIKRDVNFSSLLKLQRHRHVIAFLKRSVQSDDHNVIAARCECDRSPRRYRQTAEYRTHCRYAVFRCRFMHFDLLTHWGGPTHEFVPMFFMVRKAPPTAAPLGVARAQA